MRRIENIIPLDELEESVHAAPVSDPQFLLRGYRHAEITIPHHSFTNLVGRHFSSVKCRSTFSQRPVQVPTRATPAKEL